MTRTRSFTDHARERASHSVLVATSTRSVTPNVCDYHYLPNNVPTLSHHRSLSLSLSLASDFFLSFLDRLEINRGTGISQITVVDNKQWSGGSSRLARRRKNFGWIFGGRISDEWWDGQRGRSARGCRDHRWPRLNGEAVLRGGGGGG